MDRASIIEEDLRTSTEYRQLVEHFLEVATEHARLENSSGIRCPCRDCMNDAYLGVAGVRSHLIIRGFEKSYKTWVWHGESKLNVVHENLGLGNDQNQSSSIGGENDDMDYDDHLNDLTDDVARHFVGKPEALEAMYNNKKTPLYKGSLHTVLSATLVLMNLKARNGFSDKAMTEMLAVITELLPAGNLLPNRSYAAKRILCPMGMELEKIHACPNDCMLYRGEDDEKLDRCRVCSEARYITKKEKLDVGAEVLKKGKKLSPAKVVWYLPIIPRLERLFANKEDAKQMLWYCKRRKSNDDVIRHTSDGDQWKKIDELYPKFAKEERNLRLGLSTDGMNPYGDMSSTHSSWPVMVVIYNLPSWLTMKRKHVLLSLMISGPKQPGNDIDVYLAPLIDDLKKLWYGENWTYDGYRNEWFKLNAVLLFTINDFPALGNLSGYSVKGHLACPICEKNTFFCQLSHGKKTVYLGHRRFLGKDNPMRRAKKWFDGKVELRSEPIPLSGTEILETVRDIANDFGKNRKKKQVLGPWKKCSIFFELPYWEHLGVRHCLDVMHIEKNVCDSLIGTLLGIPGKTKDGLNSRKDLSRMGLREELVPSEVEGKTYLPAACYTMSVQEKTSFCQFLKDVKVPTTYASKIGKCVSVQDLKIGGLKSHDCHNLMQELIVIALYACLPSHVRNCISRLCLFFKSICRKSISRSRLDKLQVMVVDVLCRLEMYFPPSFFDIMVHLIVHLVREVKLCGPVYLRWMYPFERYMKIFKCFVKNRYRPDASIVQRYVTEESIEFCIAYMSAVDSVGLPHGRHELRRDGHGLSIGNLVNPSADDLATAHLYVLRNHPEVAPYIGKHMTEIKNRHKSWREERIVEEHVRTFDSWLAEHVGMGDHSESVKWLSSRPAETVVSYTGYDVHGYTYGTKTQDEKGISQNSGVSVISNELVVHNVDGRSASYVDSRHFGTITNIWELNYVGVQVVVFKCDWVDPDSVVKDESLGLTMVNRKRRAYKQDSFILATQGDQVFYVPGPANRSLEVVLNGKKAFVGLDLEDYEANVIADFPIDSECEGFSFAETATNLKRFQTRMDHDEGIWINDKGNARKRTKIKVKKSKRVKKN